MPVEIHKGDKVLWKWKLESGDINSTVTFKYGETTTQVYKGIAFHLMSRHSKLLRMERCHFSLTIVSHGLVAKL